MKLLFVHDHPFRLVDGKIYSTGGLSNDVLSRYTQYCDTMIVVARIIEEDIVDNRWSLITNKKVKILGNNTLKYNGLEKEINQCDKMIVRLPSFLGLQALHYNNKYKKQYLVEMVGCAWDALWNHGIPGKLIAPWVFIENRKLVKNAPYVLYVTKEFLQKRYPTNGKSIGCSDVEIPSLDNQIEEQRIEKIKKCKKPLIIGTIAAVDVRYKGQEYVIKALGLLKKQGIDGFEYHLVGNGSNEFLSEIAKKNNILDNVKFIGGLPHENVFDWLDSIDIYIQPSKTEGLPRSVVEAMSRGLPIIGSETGGIPELIPDKYRYEAKDVSHLADILRELKRDTLLEMSRDNFKKAHLYEKTILDRTRYEFYDEFFRMYC